MATALIKSLVDQNREALNQRLPQYLSPQQFFQMAYEMDKIPKLAGVAQRNPNSILNAIFKAADCGLMIGSAHEHCWVLPFGDEAVFVVGWRGLVYQWLRAGAVLKVDSQIVYKGDVIEVIAGDDEKIIHRPKLDDPKRDDPKWLNDPKNIIGAYAIATLPAGLKARRWCPKGEIEFARMRSPSHSKPDSPWNNNYPAMARKTPIRRLAGQIQACGPTPENREAWERYERTIEVDNKDFRTIVSDTVIVADPTDDDDLPGDVKSTSGKGSGPAPRPAPVIEVKANDNETIPDKTLDDLMAQSSMLGMSASEFRKWVLGRTGVGDPATLTNAQAATLAREMTEGANKH